MAFIKFVAVLSVVALVYAGPLPQKENDNTPWYNYGYIVNDSKTGDNKSLKETRIGDKVIGQYYLLGADGLFRIVDYTADKNGFNAVVSNSKSLPIHTPNVAAVPIPVAQPAPDSLSLPVIENEPNPVSFSVSAPASAGPVSTSDDSVVVEARNDLA